MRISEADMAAAVKAVLRTRPNHSATFAELRDFVPRRIHLTRADRVESESRPGEELWHQIIRNLAAHEHEDFVHVRGGLRLKATRTKVHQRPEHEARRAA